MDPSEMTGLSTVDYVVFGLMLTVSFFIGFYHACKSSKNNDEYLLGGRNIGVIPMAISLCASFNSAYMILGIPAEIYSYGSQFYVMIFGTGIGVWIAGEIWIPVLYRLNLVSMYEYFELRYTSKIPRMIMTVIFVVKTTIYLGIVLYAPTMALAAVTPLSWSSCVLLLAISATVYTTIGGMKAVVWTDVFQIFIVVGGILAILIQGLLKVGGWSEMWRVASENGRIEFFNMSTDVYERHTFWNVLFGTVIIWGSPYTCSQHLVQRCLCLSSLFKAKVALYSNYVGQFIMVTLVAIIGLVLFAFYSKCDPVMAGYVEKRDAVIPLFVLQEFAKYPGVAGLFISCLFSGALSSLDSALNSLAAVTWEEMKMLTCFRNISKSGETNITKALSVLYGLLAMGLAFVCHDLGSLISVGSRLFGACMGPMFGLCLSSILFPGVNLAGATSGLVVGQVINIWLSFGAMIYAPAPTPLPLSIDECPFSSNATDAFHLSLDEWSSNATDAQPTEGTAIAVNPLYLLSYNIYPIIGNILTMLIAVLVSFFTGGNKRLCLEDEKYFYPPAWKVYTWLRPELPSSTVPTEDPESRDNLKTLHYSVEQEKFVEDCG